MFVFFFSMALLQNAPHQSWEQHLSDLIFEGHLENHQLKLLNKAQGESLAWKVVADGVRLPMTLRIFHDRADEKENNEAPDWVFGAIESFNPSLESLKLPWTGVSQSAKNGVKTKEISSAFTDPFEVRIFSSIKDIQKAVQAGEIQGWICPQYLDSVMKNQLPAKTSRVFEQIQDFSWWASPEILNQESPLKYRLYTLIRDVSHFQSDASYRKQVLLQFLEPLNLPGKIRRNLLKKLTAHPFMNPEAEPDKNVEYVDSRWYFLAKRLVPSVSGELLEVIEP